MLGLEKIIDFLMQFIYAFQFMTVVRAYEKGIRLRFGKFSKEVGPGLHFYLPFFIDTILTENSVIETMRVKPQTLITKDGVPIVISTVVTFSISDIKVFLLEVEGRNNVVEDSAYGATSDFILKHTWLELMDLDNLSNELTKVVRRQAKRYGIDIKNVQVADLSRCPSIRLITSSEKHLLV